MPDGIRISIAWDKTTFTDESQRGQRQNAVSVQYGRDQITAMSPTVSGTGSFTLDNRTRRYSPRNTASPLYGQIKPARPVRIVREISGTVYNLGNFHTDDNPINPDPDSKTVAFSLLDYLADFRGQNISTAVHRGIRTGQAIGLILDACGWPATLRDLDTGATVIQWWWESETDALTALEKVVRSEGPPAMLTMGPDGEVVFRDRHHRLLRSASQTSQQTWVDVPSTFTPAAGGWSENFNSTLGQWHGPATVTRNTTAPVIEGAGQMRFVHTWAASGLSHQRLDNGPIAATNRTAHGLAFHIKARLAAGGPTDIKVRLEIFADGDDREGEWHTLIPDATVTVTAQFASTLVDSMQHWSIAVERENSTAVTTTIDFDELQQGTQVGPMPSVVMNRPFSYDEAWGGVVNHGSVSVDQRLPGQLEPVWTSDSTITLAASDTKLITVSGTDPFYDAQTPVEGVDYILAAGTAEVTLFRTSGGSTTIKLVGSSAVITGLQLRACPVSVGYSEQVEASDELSRADYGTRSFDGDLPWCGSGDAQAVLKTAVALRSQPLPVIQVRFLVGKDPVRAPLLARDLGDRVTVVEAETVTNGPFFIESIAHEASSPFEHAVTFGLEAAPVQRTPTIRLNVSGLLGSGYLSNTAIDPQHLLILGDNTSGHRLGEGMLAW